MGTRVKVIISGPEDGEHLYVEWDDVTIVLRSHEMAITKVDTKWRERVLAAFPKSVWLTVARILGGETNGT